MTANKVFIAVLAFVVLAKAYVILTSQALSMNTKLSYKGSNTMKLFNKMAITLFLTVTMGNMANADMSLQCGDGTGSERLVYVDEGWNDKMTVWNPETPNIKIEKPADNISRGHFIAYESDAWRLIYDTSKSTGILTNTVFGDRYGCF